jgi:hypothetical protein
MMIVVLAALMLYTRSNKVSADQQQYVELQHDVRAATYFLARDIRMAGSGLPETFAGYALEGFDNEPTGGTETPDRLRLLGSIEEGLVFGISQYQGSSATADVDDYSLEQNPYPDSFFVGKTVLILPNPASPCRGGALREISAVRHNEPGTNEGFNFSPGQAPGINPPGGLSDVCSDSDYLDGGSLLLVDVLEYWLDVTGSASGLTPGVSGYIGDGIGGVLYLTKNGVHYSMAQGIETIQFRYDGDLNNDGQLDGPADWNEAWTLEQVGRIRQIRIQILGRTRGVFASVPKNEGNRPFLYRRPAVANTPAADAEDWHKRFLLESASAVRNLGLSLYNTGQR